MDGLLGVRKLCPICKSQQFESKMIEHITKKCKAYKKNPGKFAQCKFNPLHWKPIEEIALHEKSCGSYMSETLREPIQTFQNTPAAKGSQGGLPPQSQNGPGQRDKKDESLNVSSSSSNSSIMCFQCPFDKSHKLECSTADDAETVAKIVEHHIKRKCKTAMANPRLYLQCKYNKVHWVKESEMERHLGECPDGENVKKIKYPSNITPLKLNMSNVCFDISDDEGNVKKGYNSPTLREVIRDICKSFFPLSREEDNRGQALNGSETNVSSSRNNETTFSQGFY